MTDAPETTITLERAREMAEHDMPLPEAFYIDANGDVQWKPGRETQTTEVPLICPVCEEEIEDGDGTEQGGIVTHYVCLGECDE